MTCPHPCGNFLMQCPRVFYMNQLAARFSARLLIILLTVSARFCRLVGRITNCQSDRISAGQRTITSRACDPRAISATLLIQTRRAAGYFVYVVLPRGSALVMGRSTAALRISAWAATASLSGSIPLPAGPVAPNGPPNGLDGSESSTQPRSRSSGMNG